MAVSGVTRTPRWRVRGKAMIALILAAIIVLGLLVSFGVYYLMPGLGSSLLGLVGAANGERQAERPVFLDMEDMVITLPAEGGRQKFLKLRVSLEVASEADLVLVSELLPLVIDSYQLFLRELRVSEIEGSQGVYRIKEELLARTNLIVAPATVNSVLFRDLLVQ